MILLPYTVTALSERDGENNLNVVPNSVISLSDFNGSPQLMFDSPDDTQGELVKRTLDNGQRVIYIEAGIYQLTVNNNVTAFAISSPRAADGNPVPIEGVEAIIIDIEDIRTDIVTLFTDGVRDSIDRTRRQVSEARQQVFNRRTTSAVETLELTVSDPNQGVGASFTRLNEVFTTIDGISTAINQINLNATNERDRLDASLSRIDAVETDTSGNAQALNLLSIRVDNQVTGLSSAVDRITQVEFDADNNASAIDAVLAELNDPINGLAASFALAQQADIAASGAASSITTVQNDVQSLTFGLNSTTIIATQARTTANGNASAIAGLQTRVSDAEQEASASLALAADLDTELDEIRAVALLSVNADGSTSFIQLGATPTQSQIKFGADEVIFVNALDEPAIFFNTATGNYQFNGTGVFSGGLNSSFNDAYLEVGLNTAAGTIATATLGYSVPGHLSEVRANSTGVNISGSNSLGGEFGVVIGGQGRTRLDSGVEFREVVTFTRLINGGGSLGGTVNVQRDMFINRNLDVNGTITNVSAGHHILLPKGFVAEVGDLIKLDTLMYQSISRNLGYGSVCDTGRPWGVFTDQFEDFDGVYDLHILQSIGEGQIMITNENGDILKDDLLTLSSTPGKAMKQDDDIIRSSTVACAVESHTFATEQSTALISCIYHIG